MPSSTARKADLFTRQGEMTDASTVSRQSLTTTRAGMAHFAHTGPQGTYCGKCQHWQRPTPKTKQACDKFRALTGQKGGPIPAAQPSCKYWQRVQ